MTRFEKELSGALGAYWKKEAKKELERVKKDLDEGKITIDENGIARNCIGRTLHDDMLEKVAMVSDKVNIEATRAARQEETAKVIDSYRASYKGVSHEEMSEMVAVFGTGTTVVNILMGTRITL